jgi:diguanylate cyclase (GGDEF)-like protein
MGQFVDVHGIVRAEVRSNAGLVIVSDAPIAGTQLDPIEDQVRARSQQQAQAAFLEVGLPTAAGPGTLPAVPLLREVFPLVQGGAVLGVVVIWRDATPILAELDSVRGDLIVVTFSAALVAAAVLTLVFRSAQGRITRQTFALLEAARRDPLTGLLNHGALVEELTEAIERARSVDGSALPVALLDIDNFRLLNETYGHGTGDRAIGSLVATLQAHLPAHSVVGRYGPDELLVVREDMAVEALEILMHDVMRSLTGIALDVGEGDPLPLTVSIALCSYPEDGSSVTALLASAAVTLQEAKASGGNSILRPNREEEAAQGSGFNVFQGLILAVDTKDRYTKRHSEDVARYALFLARQTGVAPEELDGIRVAGLLHDVGKIGIPDAILRKPGKLTADEYEIVKQHVALGSMIVRDVPGIDMVRTGILHHHERIDGRGYLSGLAGDDIPLVARILAVGDAFSAMTTSRPYRKAIDLAEALRRLEDAAGSQLDERLVAAFVQGIETVPGAPLPGDDAGRLWLPALHVA